MSKISQMFLEQKIYGDGFRLAHSWLFGRFTVGFPSLSLGLSAAYSPLSDLIFMRFCPALGFPQVYPQLPCMAPVFVLPYANAYQMVLFFDFSRLEVKVPSAHTGRMRWKSCIFDGNFCFSQFHSPPHQSAAPPASPQGEAFDWQNLPVRQVKQDSFD